MKCWVISCVDMITFQLILKILGRNPPQVRVTSGQKLCTKIIYIVLQTSGFCATVFNIFSIEVDHF